MAAEVVVYQLNIVLREVEPTVWRRVLVRSDTGIALLHQVVQVAMGWEDAHLHKFRIHGRDYGTSCEGGIMFSTNPQEVLLDGFQLRAGERFRYEYDFGDFWEHDLRLERVLPLDPKKKWTCTCDAEQWLRTTTLITGRHHGTPQGLHPRIQAAGRPTRPIAWQHNPRNKPGRQCDLPHTNYVTKATMINKPRMLALCPRITPRAPSP